MKKSQIAALVGSILYTLIAVLGLMGLGILLLLSNSSQLQHELGLENLAPGQLLQGLGIAYVIIVVLAVLNWIGYAKLLKLPQSQAQTGRRSLWPRYFLILGIFYVLTSMFNGIGLIFSLPIGICFVLAYVFHRRGE